jgi:acyl-CoA reductase-like NAD-dependent aldehyde dehydrogenase
MASFKTYNPYDDSLVGEFNFDDKKTVDSVLDKLEAGKKIQAKLTAHERSEILRKLGDLLNDNTEEMAALITKEMGKTIQDSRVEMQRSMNTAYCSSDEARNMTGEVLDSDAYLPKRGRIGIVRRKPLGVVLCITPFNFPINLAMHKIGPAFAAGNTIFFKPGPQNYQSGKKLVELCHKAGMPAETIQFCFPDIPELTEVIKGDRIQCVSFTGGTATADAIARNAGRKKLCLELGGNDPLIVMPDGDIDKATSTAINQRFATAGQRCTASKRLFVHSEVYDAFKNMLVEKAKKLVVGDPTKEETFCGPLANKQAADNVEKRIRTAIDQEGATCLLGGKREGNIIYPTILENVHKESELICDETFGPVIPLMKFDKLDDIIPMINSTGFGLQSGVFTNDIRVIEKLYDELDVGALAVNDGPGFRAEHFPFGGVKNSGLGREGVKYAIDEMSILKTLIL